MEAIEGNKTIPPDELARRLAAIGGFLRSDTDDAASADKADQAAGMAREDIGAEDQTAETPDTQKPVPEWAEDLAHPEQLFVEKKREIRTWHPVAKPLGKGRDEVEVHFRRMDSELSPGGTKEEQGIELEIAENNFSNGEWEYVVKPILERYVKALELKILSRSVTEKQKDTVREIKRIIPEVFRGGEFPDLKNMRFKGNEFRRQIGELINEMNTNPEVLKTWIAEIIQEEAPRPVQKRKIGKGEKAGKQPYGKIQKKAWLDGYMQNAGIESSDDKYKHLIDKLAGRISKLGAELLYLNTKHIEGIYQPPKEKEDFVETPYTKKTLKQLSERAARQLDQKKGMVSIIGDMGTGKNYLVEHFASKTHRPFFYFPCSRGMDAADLGFHFEFRKGESITVPSNLAKGLQTKNAVILIDEPNALPPEVVSALHGLADHNRSFVYNGVTFQAAEGVIIVMAMNPAAYAHVKSLPEAFSDRTLGQDMYLGYPPLTRFDQLAQENLWSDAERQQAMQKDNSLKNLENIYICDEALILKNQFPELKNWPDEDFTKLWDVVINGQGESLLGEKAEEAMRLEAPVKVIHTILEICDIWRKRYQTGDMQRTISLRGSAAVAANFLQTKNVRKAFLDLYKPNSFKYDGGREDYETLEQILNDKDELAKPPKK